MYAAASGRQIARATFWEKLTQPQQARAHAGRSNLALPLGPVTAGSRTLQTAEYGVRMGDSRSVPSKRASDITIEWGSSDSYRRWLAFDSAASVLCVPGIWYEAAVDLQLPLSYMPAQLRASQPFFHANLWLCKCRIISRNWKVIRYSCMKRPMLVP